MDNRETFWHYYGIHLQGFAELGRYGWPASEAPTVAAKMRAAWERGTGSKDGDAFKATCKQLGISHTYKAINAYLGGATAPDTMLINITERGKAKQKRVEVFARFDYVIDGKPHAFAVTPSMEDSGLHKVITHVASTKRVTSLALALIDSNTEPYRAAFMACKGDDYVAQALVIMRYVVAVYGDRLSRALAAEGVRS